MMEEHKREIQLAEFHQLKKKEIENKGINEFH
jgi:hypothetical protein